MKYWKCKYFKFRNSFQFYLLNVSFADGIITVGTSGYLAEILRQKNELINLRKLRVLILDEADRLLDGGKHTENIEYIVKKIHQGMFFVHFYVRLIFLYCVNKISTSEGCLTKLMPMTYDILLSLIK